MAFAENLNREKEDAFLLPVLELLQQREPKVIIQGVIPEEPDRNDSFDWPLAEAEKYFRVMMGRGYEVCVRLTDSVLFFAFWEHFDPDQPTEDFKLPEIEAEIIFESIWPGYEDYQLK